MSKDDGAVDWNYDSFDGLNKGRQVGKIHESGRWAERYWPSAGEWLRQAILPDPIDNFSEKKTMCFYRSN